MTTYNELVVLRARSDKLYKYDADRNNQLRSLYRHKHRGRQQRIRSEQVRKPRTSPIPLGRDQKQAPRTNHKSMMCNSSATRKVLLTQREMNNYAVPVARFTTDCSRSHLCCMPEKLSVSDFRIYPDHVSSLSTITMKDVALSCYRPTKKEEDQLAHGCNTHFIEARNELPTVVSSQAEISTPDAVSSMKNCTPLVPDPVQSSGSM